MTAILIRSFLRDDRGATAIEYALLATIMGVALAATFALLGDTVVTLFGVGTGGASDTIGAQIQLLPGNRG